MIEEPYTHKHSNVLATSAKAEMSAQISTIPAWVNPDLQNLVEIIQASDFRTSAISKVSLPAGALFARITGVTVQSEKAYTTVQAGTDLHIELNSDLVYLNHSCDPTLELDMARYEVRVRKDRQLLKGEPLTFFYPSTEWNMAQPFDCWCGAPDGTCLRKVEGADRVDRKILDRYYINDHINAMLKAQEASGGSN